VNENQHQHLPNVNHLSVITAMILLAYALTAFIQVPVQSINWQLPGFLLTLRFNFISLISIVVAVMAAAGADWIVKTHPHTSTERRFHHWLIPAFTALVIGIPLNEIQVSPSWWAVFALGGLLLVGVFISEYISVDPLDIRFPIARVSLTAMSFALLLVLLIAVRGGGLRLYTVLATLLPAIALVSAKTLHLRLGGWSLAWTVGISIALIQLATGLFYLPVKPLQFGLILLGLTFALVSLAGNLEEKQAPQTIWLEPILSFTAFLSASLFF
jgi:hypothetical protein